MMAELTAVYERINEYWIGYVEELPGANAQGMSLDEVRGNLLKAAQHIVDKNREYVNGEMRGKSVIRELLTLNE